jgi:uncharacterized small protein (DUF1192 family)
MELSVEALEQRIAELQARLPRHSVPAAMWIELEELEQELERRLAQRQQKSVDER